MITFETKLLLCGSYRPVVEGLAAFGVLLGGVSVISIATKKFPLTVELAMGALTLCLGFAPMIVGTFAVSSGRTVRVPMGTDLLEGDNQAESDVPERIVPIRCTDVGVDFSAPGLALGAGALLFALIRKRPEDDRPAPLNAA